MGPVRLSWSIGRFPALEWILEILPRAESDGGPMVHCAVDRHVFDVRVQTQGAMGRLRSGIPETHPSPAGERDSCDGSQMRVLPLAHSP